MALSITQQPQAVTPAYNDQYFTMLSDQVAQPDFKYVVEVTINGNTTTYEYFPDPDGYLVFNAKEDASNKINRDYFNPASTSVDIATGKYQTIGVKVLEYYSGTVIGHYSEEVFYIVWDACLKDLDFRNYNYVNYIANGADVLPLSPNLTDILGPDNRITVDTDIWLHFIGNGVDQVDFTIKDELGVIQDSFSASISSPSDFDFYYLNIGNRFLQSNTTPFTPADGWTVTVDLVDTDTSTTAYTITYTFTTIYSNYDVKTVYYLKRNGNIAFKHFEQVSGRKASKKTTSALLSQKRVISGEYKSNIYDHTNRITSTQVDYSGTLNTGWITESELSELDELFDSPLTWINEGGNYIPITVSDQQFEYKEADTETLISLTINYDYSQQETRQRAV